MRIGGSLVLIAIGAVLKWAVSYRASGINISTVGTILLIVGILGLVLSLVMSATRRRTDVISERNVVAAPGADGRVVSRTTYTEPNNIESQL